MRDYHVAGTARNRTSIQFDPIELKRQAALEIGLEEFGEDPFGEFFARFIAALNDDGVMTAKGVAITKTEVLSVLRNRLELRDWLAREPSIGMEPIDRPILLMGLPRSGTTFMHHLFDHDPKLRLLRMWETLRPCPPPAIDPVSVVARLEVARRNKEDWQSDVENFDATHLLDPDGPDECTHLISQVFAMVGFLNVMKVSSFFRWLCESADFFKVYQHHKSVLQLLQWKAPHRRWVLKYPNYVLSMKELSNTYPDALFVVSHRDPVRTLASLCDLTHQFRAPRYADNDRVKIGQEMWYFVQKHVDHLLAFRRSDTKTRIHDVDYNGLVSDPVATVRSVYAAMDLELPSPVRERLADWTQRNPKGKRGTHTYRLEEYGLDRDRVEAGFAEYRRAFAIPNEES
jgi:hypothetical protein